MSDLYIANSEGEGFIEGDRICITNFYSTDDCGVKYKTTKYFNQDTHKPISKPDMRKLDSDLNLLRSILYIQRAELAENENITVTVNNASSSIGNTSTATSNNSFNDTTIPIFECVSLNRTIAFNSPTGNVGISNVYSLNTIDIPASGFTKAGIATAMWGKNDGIGESGLGIASDSGHEINKNNFIQLEMTSLIAGVKPNSIPVISIDSIQPSQGFTIFGSDIVGVLGISLYVSPNTPELQSVEIPNFGAYRYINIIASGSSNNSSVLLKSVDYIICK